MFTIEEKATIITLLMELLAKKVTSDDDSTVIEITTQTKIRLNRRITATLEGSEIKIDTHDSALITGMPQVRFLVAGMLKSSQDYMVLKTFLETEKNIRASSTKISLGTLFEVSQNSSSKCWYIIVPPNILVQSVVFKNSTIKCVPANNELIKACFGKTINESFSFNGKEFIIENIV